MEEIREELKKWFTDEKEGVFHSTDYKEMIQLIIDYGNENYDQGHEDGKAEGYDEGYDEGYQDGQEKS